MSNLKIKLTGARELMCSDEIHDIVAEHGRAIWNGSLPTATR